MCYVCYLHTDHRSHGWYHRAMVTRSREHPGCSQPTSVSSTHLSPPHMCLLYTSVFAWAEASSVCLGLFSVHPWLLLCPPIHQHNSKSQRCRNEQILHLLLGELFFLTHFDSIREESKFLCSYMCTPEAGASRDQVEIRWTWLRARNLSSELIFSQNKIPQQPREQMALNKCSGHRYPNLLCGEWIYIC